MKPIKTCPICGHKKVRRIVSDVDFSLGTKTIRVPQLSYDQCPNCGERFFDADASEKIDATLASNKRPAHRRSA
jgi:YgiT-type zinc finger domain-containing protein